MLPVLPVLPALAVSAAAVRPDPGTARDLLRRELARPAYRQSLVERFSDWLQDLWARLQQTALHASPLSTGAAVLAVAVLVALVEAFRTVALRSTRRGLLAERAALTAHELAEELSPLFPQQHEALRAAARSFDVVFYGDQPATADDARAVLALDDALQGTRQQVAR